LTNEKPGIIVVPEGGEGPFKKLEGGEERRYQGSVRENYLQAC